MARRDWTSGIKAATDWVTEKYHMVSNAVKGIGIEVVDTANAIFNEVQGTVTSFVDAAMPVAIAALGQLSYSGSSGNFQSATENIVLYGKFFNVSWSEDVNYIGRIVQSRDLVKNAPGFCQVNNPRVEIAGILSVEESAIEDFMRTGFYYE